MKHGKAIVVKNQAELAEMGIELGPNSPLRAKPQRRKRNLEHQAQVRLFEKIADASADPRGAERWLYGFMDIVHAVPQFTDRRQDWRSKQKGKDYKAEGQKSGIPDVHVPVMRYFGAQHDHVVASLYVELKCEAYPSETQRTVMQRLALEGNAALVIKNPDPEQLAEEAYVTIIRYLSGQWNFREYAHPKFSYIPGLSFP